MAAGVITILSSAALAQQFRDVSTEVGLIAEAKHSWGNPIWGDINNDGFLDLIVPTHGLIQSGGPFVYLNKGVTPSLTSAQLRVSRRIPHSMIGTASRLVITMGMATSISIFP